MQALCTHTWNSQHLATAWELNINFFLLIRIHLPHRTNQLGPNQCGALPGMKPPIQAGWDKHPNPPGWLASSHVTTSGNINSLWIQTSNLRSWSFLVFQSSKHPSGGFLTHILNSLGCTSLSPMINSILSSNNQVGDGIQLLVVRSWRWFAGDRHWHNLLSTY